MAHWDYTDDGDAFIQSTEPRLILSKERGDAWDVPESTDLFCPECNAGLIVQGVDDPPREGQTVTVCCWRCGFGFSAHYDMEPNWYEGVGRC